MDLLLRFVIGSGQFKFVFDVNDLIAVVHSVCLLLLNRIDCFYVRSTFPNPTVNEISAEITVQERLKRIACANPVDIE